MNFSPMTVIDIAMLLIVAVSAFDALRVASPIRDPMESLSLALISFGAFGYVVYELNGGVLTWWEFFVHAGLMLRAILTHKKHVMFLSSEIRSPNYVGPNRRDSRTHHQVVRR